MKYRIGNFFTGKSILQQLKELAAITILVCIISIMLISKYTRQIIYENADEHTKIASIQLRNQIELITDKIENFLVSVEEDENIQKLMASAYPQLATHITDAKNSLTRHKMLEPSIEDISLVNDIVHHSNVYSYEDMDAIRKEVSGVPFRWIGIREHHFMGTQDMADMLVYAGDIKDRQGINLGTAVFSVSLSDFSVESMEETNSAYFMVDEDGGRYTFNCPADIADEIYALWEQSGRADTVKNGDFYIHAYYLESMGCYLFGALQIAGSSFGMNRVQIMIWICLLSIIGFCGILLFMVGVEIVVPLQRFSQKIREMSEQRKRYMTEKLGLGGCVEIMEIEKEFTAMLNNLEALNRQILRQATDLYEMKVQKQEAELAYLRSQIDPHFLYNTLELFRTIAFERQVPEIAKMAVDMGNIFRYSTKGDYIVPFAEELSIIQSYVRIQQMRFAEKIQVFYFIPDEVMPYQVIKMLLQPVVENAIFHGLEPKQGKGKLLIGARKEEDRLIITVMDDGVGIEQESLRQIKSGLECEMPDTSRHVGIWNTNARIKLQYGAEYGLFLESRQGDGTTVTMVLPARQKEEGDTCFVC